MVAGKKKQKQFLEKYFSGFSEFKKNKMLFFIIKFFAIFFVLLFLIRILNLSFFTNFLAFFSASVLSLSFVQSSVFVGESIFVVTNECLGLVSGAILASILFSLKKPVLREKILLFILGFLVLLVINVPRVILVLFAAKSGFDANLVHMITWFIMSAIIILLWCYETKILLRINDFLELI